MGLSAPAISMIMVLRRSVTNGRSRLRGLGYARRRPVGLTDVRVVEVDTAPDHSVAVYVQTAVAVVCPDCTHRRHGSRMTAVARVGQQSKSIPDSCPTTRSRGRRR